MNQKSLYNEVKKNIAFKKILFSVFLVTFILVPQFADPFNAPKLYALLLVTAVLMQYLPVPQIINTFKNFKTNKGVFLLISFQLSVLVASLISSNKYSAFFGDIQRQMGFLAYFGLSVIFLATAYNFMPHFHRNLSIFIILVSGLMAIYGLLQYSGNDFFSWNNQYNPIILTLGNPNFASALMAVLCMLNIGQIFSKSLSIQIRIASVPTATILIANIMFSNSRQGLIALIFGFGIFSWGKLKNVNRTLGKVFIIIFFILSIWMVAGMLQTGFWSKYLYKDSISARGYYWRAGLKMFSDNPFFGVGIDNYGANFKYYREENFVKVYGHELISSNAHNVPIQLLATGGIFVGISYISLVAYIFYRGFKSLNYLQTDLKHMQLVFVSALVVFQAQSIISIDNSGLTIWGWFLMGLILNIANNNFTNISLNKKGYQLISLGHILSAIFILISLVLIPLLSRSEHNLFQARNNFIPDNQVNLKIAANSARQVTKDLFAQPAYKLEAANYLIQMGLEDEGLEDFKSLVSNYPTNPTFLHPLASMYAYKGLYKEAVKIRKAIEKYDPNNPENFLQLARLYVSLNDKAQAILYKNLILNKFPGSIQANKVQEELKFEN